MNLLTLTQTYPRARGEAQGEQWRQDIAAVIELRRPQVERALGGTAENLEAHHLAIADDLRRVDPDALDELEGLAAGARLPLAQIVLLNTYDDLLDTADPPATSPPPEGGTSMYLSGADGAVLGQTIDLHHDLQPYLRLVHVCPRETDDERVYVTLTGCLALAGMNHHGLGVVTNKLSTDRTRIGLPWTAMVRRLLHQTRAASARHLLWQTPLAGGRHYFIADGHALFGVETDAIEKVTTRKSPRTAHLHTNHYFDPKLRAYERLSSASTSFRRMEIASTLFVQRQPESAADLLAFLSSHEGYPRSVCAHASPPHDPVQTCAVIVLDLGRGRLIVVAGCPHIHPATEIELTRWRSPHPS